MTDTTVEEERPVVKPEDLHLLRFTSLDQIQRIMERYDALQIPKDHRIVFLDHLTGRRDAWFVELGDVGLIYLTFVVPRVNAVLNVLFWDGKLTRDRREAVKSVLVTAFDMFELPRITAACPVTNQPLRQMLNKIGFVLEGVARKGYIEPDGKYTDLVMFGVLDEEASTWPALRVPTISSV
jgi:hypothetical protein